MLEQLIVGCPDPDQEIGGGCIEKTPRPAAGFSEAVAKCGERRARLPLFVELYSSSYPLSAPEWTANVLSADASGNLTTLIYGGSIITSSGTNIARPYRCVFPLSNE